MKERLFELFMNELKDIYDSEHQIIKSLPALIRGAHSPKLKKGLTHHLQETKEQVRRLKRVFKLIDRSPRKKHSKGMAGLIAECKETLREYPKSALRDAAIITKAQRVEHYEIAVYGTLCAYAKDLHFDKEVLKLLKDSIAEEGHADKTLTKVAQGGFFSQGVNITAERKAA